MRGSGLPCAAQKRTFFSASCNALVRIRDIRDEAFCLVWWDCAGIAGVNQPEGLFYFCIVMYWYALKRHPSSWNGKGRSPHLAFYLLFCFQSYECQIFHFTKCLHSSGVLPDDTSCDWFAACVVVWQLRMIWRGGGVVGVVFLHMCRCPHPFLV